MAEKKKWFGLAAVVGAIGAGVAALLGRKKAAVEDMVEEAADAAADEEE